MGSDSRDGDDPRSGDIEPIRHDVGNQRVGSDADQTSSDADQTSSDADQTASDADQTASDLDAAGSRRDQRASDRDQATADHDVAAEGFTAPSHCTRMRCLDTSGRRQPWNARPRSTTEGGSPRDAAAAPRGATRLLPSETKRPSCGTLVRSSSKPPSCRPMSRWPRGSSSSGHRPPLTVPRPPWTGAVLRAIEPRPRAGTGSSRRGAGDIPSRWPDRSLSTGDG